MPILAKKINYIVYEKIQIDNGKFLEKKAVVLEDYVKKYDGVPVYVNYQNYSYVENNKFLSIPAIIVYEFKWWYDLPLDLIKDNYLMNDIQDLKWYSKLFI